MAPFRQFLLALGLGLASLLPLSAKTLTFETEKCRCEVPDDWTEQKSPDNQAGFLNPDQTKSFLLRIKPCPLDITLENAGFIRGFENSMVKNGLTITDRSHVVLGGLDAYAVDSMQTVPAGTVYNRMIVTLANGQGYGFNLSKLNGKPAEDDQLKAIQLSFAFLGTPVMPKAVDPMEKVGYYLGLFIGFLAVFSIFKWIRLRAKRRAN